jgi:hypothetical protein
MTASGSGLSGAACPSGVVRQAERKKQEKLKAKCEAEEARRRQQGQ